jgi:RNA polymerase sigma-70 factor, ECF subfamily
MFGSRGSLVLNLAGTLAEMACVTPSDTPQANESMFLTAVRDKVTPRDRTALFEGLIRDTHKQAYSLAYRLTGNSAEAEDLVQESFLRAYRFFHRYDETLPFTSWLYRIMTNAHIDMVRRRGRLKTTSLEGAGEDGSGTWDVPDNDSIPDRVMMNNALEEPVQNALNAMTAEFRTAVLLADVEGLAYEEVAAIMETSVGTVRSRIHRGRKQIRNFLLKSAPETYRSYCDEL